MIIADDLGIDAIGGFGVEGNLPVTPTLDSLRGNGLSFTNCWATPQCTPTRAAIMSGKYGIKTGVFRPPGPLETTHTSLFNKIDELTNGAYQKAAIGKWHLGGNDLDHPADTGADHFEGFLTSINDYYDWTKVTNGRNTRVTEYLTSHITDAALDWVEGQEDPWLLWLAHAAPHAPFQTPPEGLYTTEPRGNRGTYQSMIEAMDSEIGRLLNSLDRETRQNTVVIFIGDNGTPNSINTFFTRGRVKGSIYEGGLRVPMIISGKNISRGGEVEEGLIQAADLYATIMELAGAELPGGIYNSLSLKPQLTESKLKLREFIYSDYNDDGLFVWALRTDRYKLIIDENGNQEFYDIIEDIKEENNLINNLSSEQSMIKEMLEQEANMIRTDWSCNDNIQNGDEASIDNCDETTSTIDLITLGFKISPNPNNGSFKIAMPGDEEFKVNLFDSAGSFIKTENGRNEIIFKELLPGIYTVLVNQNKNVIGSSRIVVF